MALQTTKTKQRADKNRTEELAKLKEARAQETLAAPIVGRAVPPDADTTDPVELAKQDPRVGPQDIPLEERTDGVTAGIRHDQMQGVQSAAWVNDLDEEELLAEQLANPANTAVAADKEAAAVILGEKSAVPPRTQAEMDRGKEALAHRGPTRALAPSTEEAAEAKATKSGSQPASQGGDKAKDASARAAAARK